jgi:hypothetical protein
MTKEAWVALCSFALRFQDMAPSLQTPDGARGRCQFASLAFLSLLEIQTGVIGNPVLLELDGFIRPQPADHPVEVTARHDHWVARVGDTHFDWTARQFDAAAPWPLVWMSSNRPAPWCNDWRTPEDRVRSAWAHARRRLWRRP